jgi:hypothetical protein
MVYCGAMYRDTEIGEGVRKLTGIKSDESSLGEVDEG